MDSQQISIRHSKKSCSQPLNSLKKERKRDQGVFPNSSYVASITLKAKPDKDVKMQKQQLKRKENYRPMLLMNIDSK